MRGLSSLSFKWFSLLGAAGAPALAAIIWTSAADAQNWGRTWTVMGQGPGIAIADCADCGENFGMLVSCQGPGRPADVIVPWVALPDGSEGMVLPLTFRVQGRTFTYQATTEFYSPAGYAPRFALFPNDPLIGALQSGFVANIQFGDVDIDLPLRGSGRAFEVFQAQCPWTATAVATPGPVETAPAPPPPPAPTDDPVVERPLEPLEEPPASEQETEPPVTGTDVEQDVAAAPVEPAPPPLLPTPDAPETPDAEPDAAANGDGEREWFTTRTSSPVTDNNILSLFYGVPETDVFLFRATCEEGYKGPFIPVLMDVDFGDLPGGVPQGVLVRGTGFEQIYRGTVSIAASGSAGVQTAIRITDPIWTAMQDSDEISFGVANQPNLEISMDGDISAIREFLDGCRAQFEG